MVSLRQVLSLVGLVSNVVVVQAQSTPSYPGQSPLVNRNLPAANSQQGGVHFAPQNASAGFTCQYPTLAGWQACNKPGDRGCWLKNQHGGYENGTSEYNITTDYEQYAPSGVVREYWLNLTVTPIAPDGYLKTIAQIFNGTYPGPTLEACWGDRLKIHVTNYNKKEGTTVHWHGIRQLGTNQMDGVNGVTQCPIAVGDTFTYEFDVLQYGNTWYHSHYETQYGDGAIGSLVLYGPSSANYDEAFEPMVVTDWGHDNASVTFIQEFNRFAPIEDSIVFGGLGQFLCSDLDPLCCWLCVPPGCTPNPACPPAGAPLQPYATYNFQPGKKYLLRLINAGIGAQFRFSIDSHPLEIVQTDLVPVNPFKVDSVLLGIGQRYQAVVHANPTRPSADGNYWIRNRIPGNSCGWIAQANEETGIIKYNATDPNSPSTAPIDNNFDCEDPDVSEIIPMVPWYPTQPQGSLQDYTFQAGISHTIDHSYYRWEMTNQSLFLNYSNPSLAHAADSSYNYGASYAVVPYNYTDGYVWLVITAENIHPDRTSTPGGHPMHLHGHDFVILAQENATFNATEHLPKFNLNNPARRDTVMLPSNGYLALAFRPDNPGYWLVHCHIVWHASAGFALQVMERQPEIVKNLGGPQAFDQLQDGCKKWEQWNLQYDQVDSGI